MHRHLCPSFARQGCGAFRRQSLAPVLAALALLLVIGCDHKPGVRASIAELEKAFPVTAAPTQSEQPTPGQTPRADANGYVQSALSAVRSNDYATAVVMLKVAVRAPGMTPDQFLAVQEAKNALLTDLQNRAQKGDASAQTALKSIESSRTQ